MSEDQQRARRLNEIIYNASPRWRAVIGASATHRALSAALAVTGEAEPVWADVSVDFEDGDSDGSTAAFNFTVWTGDLVVRVMRERGADWPVTDVYPRDSLSGLRLLRAPNLTDNSFGNTDSELEIELTYPAFSITTTDARRGLLALLPSFIDDLKA